MILHTQYYVHLSFENHRYAYMGIAHVQCIILHLFARETKIKSECHDGKGQNINTNAKTKTNPNSDPLGTRFKTKRKAHQIVSFPILRKEQ